MHPHTKRSRERQGHVLRAAAIEMATPTPTPTPEPHDSTPKAVAPPINDLQALRDVLLNLARLAAELRVRRRQTANEIAGLSVELGIVVAERLLGAEIDADRQRLDRIVRQGLERLPAAPSISVHGHREDIALLQKQMQEHDDLKSVADALALHVDDKCPRGRLKLAAGELFLCWDTPSCVAELRAALLEETFANG